IDYISIIEQLYFSPSSGAKG
ncbi:hypothetical protein ACFRC2_21085, partial [Bacillus subtilis]